MREQPVHFAGAALEPPRHACAFFRNADEEYGVTLPFIAEGFDRGEKAFHVVRPRHRETHLQRLRGAGIDVEQAEARGQLEVLPWAEAYLRGGKFNPDAMLALMEGVITGATEAGFPMTRIIGGAEWALEGAPCIDDLFEYEARLNQLLPKYDTAVTCTYDLTAFGAGVVVDALRTHAMVVIGGLLRRNPFYDSPSVVVADMRRRRGTAS